MSERPQSPLERALIDMDQRRLKPNEFYERLLATEVFVPTLPSEESDEHEYVTEEPESFALITLEVDGQQVLPMFDEFDRLEEWASSAGSPVGYMGIQAETLLDSIDPALAVAFFAGVDGFYLFDRETLDHLRDPGIEMLDGTYGFTPGIPLQIGDVDAPPKGLIEAIVPTLRSMGGNILEAWLITIGEHDRPDSVRLTVVVWLAVDSDELFQSAAADLTQSIAPLLAADEIVEFMNVTDTDLGEELRGTRTPIFAWQED